MTPRRTHPGRGFTLLELLVVIGIIAILIGLVVGAGVAITRNAKANATRGVLTALDRALDEFIVNNGGNIPTFDRADYAGVPGFDGPNGVDADTGYLNDADDPMPQRPDASVFIRQARGVGDVDAILAGIPERFLVTTALPRNVSVPSALEANMYDTAPSVLDAWANDGWTGYLANRPSGVDPVKAAWPIREQSLVYYVHPNNRRDRSRSSLDAKPDAQELYGSTLNGRPYFFSAGPDGFYGHPEEGPDIVARFGLSKTQGESDADFRQRALLRAREDNIYSYAVDINFRMKDEVIDKLWGGGGP